MRSRFFFRRTAGYDRLLCAAARQIIFCIAVIAGKFILAESRAHIAVFQALHRLVEQDRRLSGIGVIGGVGGFVAGGAHSIAGAAGRTRIAGIAQQIQRFGGILFRVQQNPHTNGGDVYKRQMSAIAERTEQENHARFAPLAENTGKISVSDATAHAACLTAKDVNAAAIVTVSESGNTARLLSKYRPEQPIIACVMKEQVQRQLALSWGITPLMMPLAHSTDELIEMSTSLAKENGYLHNGELAVVTAGVPVGVSGTTNMSKIHMVGNCLATGVGVGRENADVTSATGKACVCRTLEEVRAKFKPGMVLVVPSTSNEMLSYVRDAAALVVEEPGLNSHAAIAGKALLKPTVVGAAGATSHIRDGLMIAVDCAHGSVQRLQA